MATAAQVRANRANARKSTGPRTAAGKERASRNAVKHGLLAREAVIPGEDPEEFESYREGMRADLAPVGPVETMLAERIVGLSWRLRRAERLQNAAFAALDDGTPTPLLDARLDEWKRLKGNQADQGVCGVAEEDHPLGRVVVEDFTRARVLDRLLLYERRIESSLYRTMAQLRQERQARAAAGTPGEVPRAECRLQVNQESVTPTRLGSFGANAARGSPTRKVAFGSSETPASLTRGADSLTVVGNHGQDAHATEAGGTGGRPVVENHGQDAHAAEMPDGIARDTTSRSAGGNHGQDAHATGTPDGATTNPVAHHSSIPSFHHSSTIPGAPGGGTIGRNEAKRQ